MAVVDTTKGNIKHIFNNMEYGDNFENLNLAKAWLQNKTIRATFDVGEGEKIQINNVNNGETLTNFVLPSKEAISNILNAPNKLKDIPAYTRADLMTRLSREIQNNINLICEVEVAARGILSKDTKNIAVPMIFDSLQYYSSFPLTTYAQNLISVSYGVVLSNTACLGLLGLILGPSLANEQKIIIQAEPKISVVVSLIIELAVRAGFPEGTIALLPGKINLNIFTDKSIYFISIFDDILSKRYRNQNHLAGKKYLNIIDGKTPMIVFNNADLESAAEFAVNAVWGYLGQLPWSVNTILVQEDVIDSFVSKLENKLNGIKVGNALDKMADIAFPVIENACVKLEKIVCDAMMLGIDVKQLKTQPGCFRPTLLVGGKVYGNNVLEKDPIDMPIVTVLPFRSANEAVSLANNSRQGFAASVWTENIGLANEVYQKLTVGTVWINSYGIFDVSNTFSLMKGSGNGHFGGKAGFTQLEKAAVCRALYVLPEYKDDPTIKDPKQSFIGGAFKKSESGQSEGGFEKPNGKDFNNAVSTAKKAQEVWNKMPILERAQCLKKLSENIQKIKDKYDKTWSQWLSTWVRTLTEVIVTDIPSNDSHHKMYDLKSYREPVGVLVVEPASGPQSYPVDIIAMGLLQGNAVIILNKDLNAADIYIDICKTLASCKFPAGVINVFLNSNNDVLKAAANHKEIGSYICQTDPELFKDLPIERVQRVLKIVGGDSSNYSVNVVTTFKNVWSNIGQSFM